MLEALAACEPDPLLVSTEPRQTGVNTETRTLSMLSDLYDRELVNIISWAKLIPGKTLEVNLIFHYSFSPFSLFLGNKQYLSHYNIIKSLVFYISYFCTGFLELPLNDQMRLLQSTWAEILTLTLSFRSLPSTGTLRFAENFTLDEKQARECGALELYQQVIVASLSAHLITIISIILSSCSMLL